MVLFPLTVRLDESDTHVYERAAEPGEWAIPGAFLFSNVPAESLRSGRMAQAFATGFLGLASFGWSTLVEVAEMTDEDYGTLINSLAMHFVARYGAPDVESALPVARQELEFARGLCDHPLNTLIAVERTLNDDGIHERFRIVASPPQSTP
jgi:hypothetical protein